MVSCWGTNWHNLHRGASHRELKGGGDESLQVELEEGKNSMLLQKLPSKDVNTFYKQQIMRKFYSVRQSFSYISEEKPQNLVLQQ
jgi:hypothetical protein